jgi:HMG (high mobility group) box
MDVESENDMLTIRIDRAKRAITRMRLERALLIEKLEEKTPAHVDDSDGTESEVSSVHDNPLLHTNNTNSNVVVQVEHDKPGRAQLTTTRRRSSTAGTSYSTISDHSPPPIYHPPPRASAHPRLNVVMHNPSKKGGRRGTPGGRAGARPSPAPKPPRDPNAPKRPTNPFLRFCDEQRDNVRALHGGDENFDLTKAMGQAWHALDEEQKQPFKNAFNEDQIRYKEDMAIYEAMKRNAESRRVGSSAHHHHHHHHHHHPLHQSSLRGEEYGSAFGEMDSEEGGDVANVTGRESPDHMDREDDASNVDVGTPVASSTPGPSGGGFTAVNRRGGLDASLFKLED